MAKHNITYKCAHSKERKTPDTTCLIPNYLLNISNRHVVSLHGEVGCRAGWLVLLFLPLDTYSTFGWGGDLLVYIVTTVLFSARCAQGLCMRQTPQQNLAAEQQFHRQEWHSMGFLYRDNCMNNCCGSRQSGDIIILTGNIISCLHLYINKRSTILPHYTSNIMMILKPHETNMP